MNADAFMIEGRAYSWRALCEQRRQQVEAWRSQRAKQLALFELKEDCRPVAERTVVSRFEQPTFLGAMVGREDKTSGAV